MNLLIRPTVRGAVLVLCGALATPFGSAALPAAEPQQLYAAGRYQEAAAALSADPELDSRADLLGLLARTYYETGEFRKAIDASERWAEREPSSGEAQRWLGKSLGRQAEQSSSFVLARKVKKAFEAAVEAEPRNVEARRDLLQFLARAPFIVGGSKRSAQLQAEAISAIDPVEGQLARALYLQLVGDEEGARVAYKEMLDLAPSGSDPYFEMAEFGEEIGDRTVLALALKRSEALRVDRRFDYYRGVAQVLEADCEAARASLSRYLAAVPPHSELPPHDRAREWLAKCGS